MPRVPNSFCEAGVTLTAGFAGRALASSMWADCCAQAGAASMLAKTSTVPTCFRNLSPSWVKAITWESAARAFGPFSWNGTSALGRVRRRFMAIPLLGEVSVFCGARVEVSVPGASLDTGPKNRCAQLPSRRAPVATILAHVVRLGTCCRRRTCAHHAANRDTGGIQPERSLALMKDASSLRKLRVFGLAGLLLLSALPLLSAVKTWALVTASGNKLQGVSMAELAKLCKGAQRTWPDGRNFTLVIHDPESPEMRGAIQKLFGVAASEVKPLVAKLNESRPGDSDCGNRRGPPADGGSHARSGGAGGRICHQQRGEGVADRR